MRRRNWKELLAGAVLGAAILVAGAGSAAAQVSPAEIANPKLKVIEETYLPQLRSLQHEIGEASFPLPFILTRYVGVDPSRQASLDSRGLEFVYFQHRLLLKTSGFYTAAFNSEQLTQNERASRVFEEVIKPVLRLITQEMPRDVECDAIGFEIAYHTRAPHKTTDFEGREILAVVLDRADAFQLANDPGEEQWQEALNRSEVYSDGKRFALALGKKDPLSLDAINYGGPAETVQGRSPVAPASSAQLVPANTATPTASSSPWHATPAEKANPAGASPSSRPVDPSAPASQADAERLQGRFQTRLDTLLKEDGARFDLVDYAPPSFALYHKQLVLQMTLRNPAAFDTNTGSIYKRAAKSFDLFLAPELKALLPKLPSDAQLDGLDFSVLNKVSNERDSSEAIEFICPLRAIRAFVDDEITSQDLIQQSIVLVNGVRIALDLQLVE